MNEQKGRLRPLIEELIFNVFKVLKENDGTMQGAVVVRRVGEISKLDEWAREHFGKTGNVRWQSVLQLQSIPAVKAGFLVKKKGVWYLTKEGIEAAELTPTKLYEACKGGYARWKKARTAEVEVTEESLEQQEDATEASVAAKFAETEAGALAAIEDFLDSKNPYEFQEMCAALLRAMGYYTPFVAPKGPDGGIDVIAYRDPLGAASPRIKVQIKHKENPCPVDEIRKLLGILGTGDYIGIFISSGGFTADSKRAAQGSHVHIELIDLPRFIALWQEFYPKMTDEDKQLMPLQAIYFLAPEA